MNVGLKPYPAMKESGTSWLAAIPGSWRTSKLRQCVRFVGGLTPSMEDRSLWDGDVPWVTPKDMKRPAIGESILRVSDKALGTTGLRLIPAGSVLMVVRGMILARRVPVAWTSHPVTVNQDMKALVPNRSVNARFLALQLEAAFDGLNPMIDEAGHGTRRLPTERLRELAIVLPSEEEQAAIVRFLDHADRRIRRYIHAKQKLIALLEEQKQATIHRAVTRGLDPGVRLKPSDVAWLGDVPEHWDVVRLGRLIELVTGFPFKSEGFTQAGEDIRLLRGVNITPGRIRWTAVVRWAQNERENYSAFELQVGDIVLGMDRPIIRSGTRVATVGEADTPALLLQRVARIRPTDELGSNFLTLLLSGKAFADYLTPIFTGISVPHLSPEQIKSFRFALPAEKEQQEIVRWVARHTKRTSATLLSAEREIQLLREYRTRLIADVVTGKLDVREAAARLPDEASNGEALGELDPSADAEEEELAEEGVVEEAGA